MPQIVRSRARWSALILGLLAVTACGSDGKSASPASSPTASGPPIKLMVQTGLTGPLSNYPEAVAGARAAAKAINDAGGVKDPAGGPARSIRIVACDDRNDPNASADCGNRAVSEGVLAMVGNMSLVGGSSIPIIAKAGIPSIADFPISVPELTDPMSFPFTNPSVVSLAPAVIAKSAGATGLHVVLLDTPATTAFLPRARAFATKTLGLEDKGATLIPPTATDYTPYAAKAASSGGAIQLAMNGAQADKMLKALINQGVDLQKTIVVEPGDFLKKDQIEKFNGAADGLYLATTTWPSTATGKPGVRRYNRELDAFGDTADARNGISILAWTGVHVVADLLPKAKEISSSALIDALKAAGAIDHPPLAPFDVTTPIPTDGPLGHQHVGSNLVIASRVVAGKITPLVDHFVAFDTPFDVRG